MHNPEQPDIENYTPDVVRQILQKWEHFKSICESTSFLVPHGSLHNAYEELHVLYLDVRRAFYGLPRQQRKVLFLTLILDTPEMDVAMRLGIPRSTLHTRVLQALEALCGSLADLSHPLNRRGSVTVLPVRDTAGNAQRAIR